jgi:hypothetical protein
MKKILYLILKKDMIKKLKVKHGSQFIDDVMETFGMPTNYMKKYYEQNGYYDEQRTK